MTHARCFARYVLIAIFIAVPSSMARGAAAPQDVRQARVIAALDTLKQKVPSASREIGWLAVRVREGIPESMVKNLEDLVEALRRSEYSGKANQVIEEVSRDLAIKGAVCRQSPEGMAVQIPLIVRTWNSDDSTKEAFGWNVHYLSAPLASSGLPGEPFPAFSSPTSKPLPPGKYVVWAQDPANPQRRGPTKEVTVGSPDGTIPAGGVKTDVLVAVK